MGQVNRIPSGFLDLLGVESLGRNPPAFSDALTPTVDLTELYAGQALSAHEQDLLHTAVDDQIIVTVPAEETWILRGASVYCDPIPSTTYFERFALMVDNTPRPETGNATASPLLWVTRRLLVPLAGANRTDADAICFGTPYVLIAGAVLKFRVIDRDAAAAARAARCGLVFSRLKS